VAVGQGVSDPVRPPRIAGAVPGDSFDPHNNSGTAAALLAALSRRGLLVRRLDVAISRSQRYRLAISTFHFARRRWQARFRRAVYEAQSRNCARLLDGDAEPNLILQLFRGFQARGLPYWLYLDTTDALRRAAGRPSPFIDGPLGYGAERKLYQDAQHIFVMASEPKTSLVRHYGITEHAVSVVGWGVNIEFPKRLETLAESDRYRGRTVLFVGRDFERKGGPELLDAFAEARSAVPDARLVILGVELERDPPGVESRGEVLDRDEVRRSYEQAAVFCLPSRFEPAGAAVTEAMAFGLPVVGTRVGGIPKAIRDGETGILVDLGDKRGLRDALVRLLADPDEAARMGRNGRVWVDSEWNWDAVVDRMLAAVSGQGARASSR
jgi:glycosyltransferase involved in cell wall biosynthesis